MASTIISNGGQYTFGMMTNRLVSGLVSANTAVNRLQEAIATASSGYAGTAGTEFEISASSMAGGGTPANLFGVVASATAGEQGAAYSYAVGQLHAAWADFWAAAQPYVEQLDNGTGF